jgi:hypothetical protein
VSLSLTHDNPVGVFRREWRVWGSTVYRNAHLAKVVQINPLDGDEDLELAPPSLQGSEIRGSRR